MSNDKRKAAERRASEILFSDADFVCPPLSRDITYADVRPGATITFNQLVEAILSGERT